MLSNVLSLSLVKTNKETQHIKTNVIILRDINLAQRQATEYAIGIHDLSTSDLEKREYVAALREASATLHHALQSLLT